MGIKHRADPATRFEHPNGSRSFRTAGAFNSMAMVENCPCEDGVRRTAHATAEADTFSTVPACVYVGKKTVGGYLDGSDFDDGWRFVVERGGRNAALIKKEDLCP